MVFPHYLLGIGIPLIIGVLGIGFYLYQQQNTYRQIKYDSPGPGYDTAYQFDSSEYDKCSICLEDMEQLPLQYLPCGHKLHPECYRSLIRREKRCPECRSSFAI